MADKRVSDALMRELFADTESRLYGVLDGASVGDLPARLAAHPLPSVCLFAGEQHPEVQLTAPYLVQLERDSALATQWFGEGWGQHWGIAAVAPAEVSFRDLRKHFRTFLRVHDADRKPLLFRYYDPRVFRVYLPTCNPQEAQAVFGPIRCYVMESEIPGESLRFSFAGDEVVKDAVEMP